jgi:Phosphatidylinositol-glycan biosynthesis class S protein
VPQTVNMAGTRLRIVSIFVSTLLVWVGWTIRGSRLHQDVRIQRQVAMALHRLVRSAMGGSEPLSSSLDTTGESFMVPALKFPPLIVTIGTTTNSTVATKPSAADCNNVQIVLVQQQQQQQPNDPDDDYWNQVCANPNLLFDLDPTKTSSRWESVSHTNIHVPYPDVVVCASSSEPLLSEATRIVWVPVSKTSTIALFYPSHRSPTLSTSQVLQALLGLVNDDCSPPHGTDDLFFAVRLTLVMEPTVPYWKDIVELVMQRAMAMDTAATTARVVNRVELHVDRSVWFDRAQTDAGSHALNAELVSAIWTKKLPLHRDGDRRVLDVVLYVPSTPLHLHNTQGNETALDGVWGNDDMFLFLVNATEEMTNALPTVEATLNRIQQQLLMHSWRLPMSSTDNNVSVQVLCRDEGGRDTCTDVMMVPSLHQTWRASATLSRRFETAQQVAASSAHATLVAAAAAAETRHTPVEATYKSAWEHVEQAHRIATILASTTAHNESFTLLVEQVHHWLDEAESTWTAIVQDAAWSWAPVVDLPLEQYAAIFLPLLFPLLVPVLVTLLREYQRYRALVSANKRGGRSPN